LAWNVHAGLTYNVTQQLQDGLQLALPELWLAVRATRSFSVRTRRMSRRLLHLQGHDLAGFQDRHALDAAAESTPIMWRCPVMMQPAPVVVPQPQYMVPQQQYMVPQQPMMVPQPDRRRCRAAAKPVFGLRLKIPLPCSN
jgi:hypothetical protein